MSPLPINAKYNLLNETDRSDDPLVNLGRMIGVRNLSIVITQLAGPIGCSVYIPAEKSFYCSLLRDHRRRDVRSRWDGTSEKINELADEWGTSPRTIRRDIQEQP